MRNEPEAGVSDRGGVRKSKDGKGVGGASTVLSVHIMGAGAQSPMRLVNI